jgi:probable phosphoglycerate mutase
MAVLVRHGLTPTTGKEMPAPGSGPELSEAGELQAKEAGDLIFEWLPALPPLGGIYCSPLSRTKQTAAIVAQVLGRGTEERPALADCDAGEWAGAPLKDLNKKPEWAAVIRHPSGFQFPGGETMAGMAARLTGEVRELVARNPGQTFIAVSHADPIKAVVADAMGLHLDLFQRISISPASVTAISYSTLGPSVVMVNWTGPSSRRAPPRPGRGAGRRSS